MPKTRLGMTANEAARILDTSPDTVLFLSRNGVIGCIKTTKHCYLEPRDVAWLKLHFNPEHPMQVKRLKQIRNAERQNRFAL